MRSHPSSTRLGYSISWRNKFLAGRSYNPQLAFFSTLYTVCSQLFEHKHFKPFLLFSHLLCKAYTNGRFLINIYVYPYRYADAVNKINRRQPGVRSFSRFLLKHHTKPSLQIVFFYLSKLFKNCHFHFVIVVNRFFRAELVSKYILNQLANKFKISKIIPTLGKNLLFNKKNKGLLVHCSGRFDRKERASYDIFNYGKVRIATLKKKVFYHQNQLTLKYGVCGVKVWLLKK